MNKFKFKFSKFVYSPIDCMLFWEENVKERSLEYEFIIYFMNTNFSTILNQPSKTSIQTQINSTILSFIYKYLYEAILYCFTVNIF